MPLEFEFSRGPQELSEAGLARDEVLFELGAVSGGRVGDFGGQVGQLGGGGSVGGGSALALGFVLVFGAVASPGSRGVEGEGERSRR